MRLLLEIEITVIGEATQIFSTFKIPGVMRFGPGEEKEAAIGAWGLNIVSVLPMVPTGFLQIVRVKPLQHTRC
jgi:hypothetical protein